MTPGSGQLVFLDHSHLPVSVLHVLAEEGGERAARLIPTLDFRVLPDSTSPTIDPKVVLVILIPNQFLIKIAEPLEHFASPAPQVYAVHRPHVIRPVTVRPPGSKPGSKRRGHSSRQILSTSCHPRAAHVIGAG